MKVNFKFKNVIPFILTKLGLIIFAFIAIVILVFINISYNPITARKPKKISSSYLRSEHLKYESYTVKNVDAHIGDFLNNKVENENATRKKCEIIHVGFVCAGISSNFFLHTALKSIFFYREQPIHFHFIVSKQSRKVLKTLLDTWDVPNVRVSFYNINDNMYDVRWVPNAHYSGVFGLMKLVFPRCIPLEITNKIIVLDTDLVFVDDIYDLWKLFDSFTGDQAIGIVDNQSGYYLRQNSKTKPWPAIGTGFNSGVVLYDLKKMKKLNWSALWPNVTKKVASTYGSTRLGDQDIINAILANYPELLYKVPCYWNTQLSDYSTSSDCYERFKVKVIHWNSPSKLNSRIRNADYFKSVYDTFLEMNGNLLRRQLLECEKFPKNFTTYTKDICSSFNKAQNTKWRTFLSFHSSSYEPKDYDVTLVAQLSFDRLQMVEDLLKYWNGPASFTIYVTDLELEKAQNFIEQSESLQKRTNVAYHAVFKDGDYYPINILRNVALKNVNTPYVFLSDIDFLPMKGLYYMLRKYLSVTKPMKNKALIVPAFETQRYRSRVPLNKNQLLKMLEEKVLFPFRFDVWAAGHAPIKYEIWKTATTPYKVEWEPDFEPYIVVNKNVVEYDNSFMGFGWNKVSHIMELEAQGYSFYVLPDVFMIHKAHAPSYDIAMFRSSPDYRMCLQNLKEKFVEKLRLKYGRVFDNKNNTHMHNVSS